MNTEKSSRLYAVLSVISVLGALFFIGHAIFAMSTSIVADTTSSSYSSITNSVAKSVDTSVIFQRHTVLALDVIGFIGCLALFVCSEAKRPVSSKAKKVVAKKPAGIATTSHSDEEDDGDI